MHVRVFNDLFADARTKDYKSYPKRCVRHFEFYTVRPNTVAGEAGHVRLERPIDSSSDKTVCAPKVAEKGPYSRDLINKPLTDPDFCFCCQHVLLFSRGIWEIHAEFLAFFVQNYRSYPTIHAIDHSSSRTYGRAHSVKG